MAASATTQDSAETSGTSGAPGRGRTWVPGWFSDEGGGAAGRGAPGSASVSAVAGLCAAASSPAAQTAEQVRAARVTAEREAAVRNENPIVIPQT